MALRIARLYYPSPVTLLRWPRGRAPHKEMLKRTSWGSLPPPEPSPGEHDRDAGANAGVRRDVLRRSGVDHVPGRGRRRRGRRRGAPPRVRHCAALRPRGAAADRGARRPDPPRRGPGAAVARRRGRQHDPLRRLSRRRRGAIRRVRGVGIDAEPHGALPPRRPISSCGTRNGRGSTRWPTPTPTCTGIASSSAPKRRSTRRGSRSPGGGWISPDVSIAVHRDGTFRARLRVPTRRAGAGRDGFDGRWVVGRGLVVAATSVGQ